MSVKTNAVLVCTLSLLLSACSGGASAPDSAEDAKISAEVDKILRDYQTGSDTSPGQCLTLSGADPGGYLR
jgi:colicin import membrane protein